MKKITSREALEAAYNASKGELMLRITDKHDLNSKKKDILCCGGTGCHASNSQEMMECARRCIKNSRLSLVDAPPTLASEDFALYRRYVPSFFFWVGSRMMGADIHELHSPQFFADDSAITYAAELYAACAV